MITSKLTAQSQISVPAAVRRKLGVGPGAVLAWDAEGDHVSVRRVGKFSSKDIRDALFGAKPVRKSSLTELKAAVGKHIRQKHARD